MLAFLAQILRVFGKCPHEHITRPWRDEANGKDYYTCLDCTKVIESPIQFGKRKKDGDR
jgi:hypothetical protein